MTIYTLEIRNNQMNYSRITPKEKYQYYYRLYRICSKGGMLNPNQLDSIFTIAQYNNELRYANYALDSIIAFNAQLPLNDLQIFRLEYDDYLDSLLS